jgi:transposase-like protein
MGTHGKNSREIKLSIVRRHDREGISVSKLANECNVAPQTIYGWLRQYRLYGEEDSFIGCGYRRHAVAELRKLREENKRLKSEIKSLKHS